MKEKVGFVLRVLAAHVVTYILCGVIFSALFHYDILYQQGNTKYFMRPLDGSSSLLGPAFQIVRGLLFGLILLLIKDSIIQKKYGWLKLWAIIAVIGIFNTPGPSPCSIEGMIYTQLPCELHLKGAPEILVQTLLFSCLVANPFKLKNPGLEKYKLPVLSALLAGLMFSLSGIVLALILGLDAAAGTDDTGAFIVMAGAIAAVFIACKWYSHTAFRLKNIALALSCYTVLAILPTIYNYLTGSVFASPLALVINAFPAAVIFFINLTAPQRTSS